MPSWQVVIGGRNKYFINGHNAQPQRVQNLFHSVQLNVNNPHFLIMQVCIASFHSILLSCSVAPCHALSPLVML